MQALRVEMRLWCGYLGMLGLVGWMTATGAVSAATLKPMTDAELVEASDRVVRGRVLDVRVERRPGTGILETVARLAVTEDFTGETSPIVEVREIGGALDGVRLFVPGAARFIVGDDIVVLLERKGTAYRPVAMGHAAFGVRDATEGDGALWRQDTGAHTTGALPSPARQSLRGFATMVASVTRRQSVRHAVAMTAPLEGNSTPVADAFTLLGQMRWNQPDTGQQVVWYRNTLTPAPLSTTTAVNTAMQNAVTAWSAPPEASLLLAYGGTRNHSAASLLNCSQPPVAGGGLVTFEDPYDDIVTSGVIAIGGACATANGGTTVNGLSFSRITYGFVIFTTLAEMPQLSNSLFFTRVATHEIGHAIGLGHTQTSGAVSAPKANIMYPSCCFTETPVPPSLGADDLAGLAFIYPAAAAPPVCAPVVSPTTFSVGASGGTVGTVSVAIESSCSWTVGTPPPWLTYSGSAQRTGPGSLTLTASANGDSARSGQMLIAAQAVSVSQAAAPPPPPSDTDGDGLPDAWEVAAGLNPLVATGADGAAGDPDNDGRSNLVEFVEGTHPRGTTQRYLAEGVSSGFFSTRIALVNPSADTPARVQLRFAGPADPTTGAVVTRQHWLRLEPQRRATVDASAIQGLTGAFATTVESDTLVVVDRTVTWDADGYGSSGETAAVAPHTTWYFAEGATGGGFSTFYLLLNPGTTPATTTVTYLRAGGPPRTKTYDVRPGERVTVWVDMERWPDGDSLANAEVSARIDASAPIIAERAMYLDRGTQLFTAGHASLGTNATATRWSFAEGATGDYFELFYLLANPTAADAVATIRFFVDGAVIEHPHVVPAFERSTVWVDALGHDARLIARNPDYARLANSAVSAEITVDNAVGILAERSMWWPGTSTTWAEAHNSPGVTARGTRWALAEGEVGGARNHATYILVANAEAVDATVRVTLMYEDRPAEVRIYPVPANSRFNIPVGTVSGAFDYFPNAVGRRVGALVESVGAVPVPIVVERAMYSDIAGQRWAAGHNAVATLLR